MASAYLRVNVAMQQIENHALRTEQDLRVVANHGQHLAGMHAHAVEDLRMAHNLETCMRLRARIEAGVDLKKARNGAEAGHHQVLAGDDRGGGAQAGIDGQMRGGIARSLVLQQGLLQQCVDAMAFPVHSSASSC